MSDLPDFINLDGKQIPILEFMLMPCQTKEALHRWIELFLGIDFPDGHVDEGSNSSPMEFIWWLYDNCVLHESLTPLRALTIACRSGYKTLALSVAELLVIGHGDRSVAHIGAIEDQAKKCYSYFTNYLQKDLFKQLLITEPTLSETKFKSGEILQIMPCTQARVNSPHCPFICLDEVDLVRDLAAYRDISGIPSLTKDGFAAMRVGISTMKTLYGLVAQEVAAASQTDTKIFRWNIIDITRQCSDSRSGIEPIDIYTREETLEAISTDEWKRRPLIEQNKFIKHSGFNGCIKNCRMFASCKCALKKQNNSASPLMYSVEYAQAKIFADPVDWALAQLLCRKPSTEGVIYTTFNYADHVHTYNQQWEMFLGEPFKKEVYFDDIRMEFEKRGIYPSMSVDFGDQVASAHLEYADGKNNVYVLKEQLFTATDDNELALWLWTNWGMPYNVQMVYPDVANPSGIRLLKKQGFTCSEKVDKDINAGINTVRSFLRIPGTNIPKISINESCKNLIWEFPRYHRKKMPNDLFSEDPEDINNHSLDDVRYYLHTKFGASLNMIAMFGPDKSQNPLIGSDSKHLRAPTVEEVARDAGIKTTPVQLVGTFNLSDPAKPGEEPKDPRSGGESGGFSWSF